MGFWLGGVRTSTGVDLSAAGAVSFWLRVVARTPQEAPPAGYTWVTLGGREGRSSRAVLIHDCDELFRDGNWHKIVVPLSAFYVAGATNFDPTEVRDLALSTTSPSRREFDLYVDDIAVEPPNAVAETTQCQRTRLDLDELPPLPTYPCPPPNEGPETARGHVLSEAVLRPLFREHWARFQACYEPRRIEDPDFGGRITLAFSVAPDGSLKNAAAICTSLPDAAVVDCVLTAGTSLRFPASEKGFTSVRFPLDFHP